MCIGTAGQVDWQALSAVGGLLGVLTALAIAVLPSLAKRRGWRRVSIVTTETFDQKSGSPTLGIHLSNGGDREIRSVEVHIWTVSSQTGKEYRDSMFYAFVLGGDVREIGLRAPESLVTPSPVRVDFTDWTGRRFTVRSGEKPSRHRPPRRGGVAPANNGRWTSPRRG
jgi:hypothetical protein